MCAMRHGALCPRPREATVTVGIDSIRSHGWPPVAVPESEAYTRSRDQIEAMIRKIDTYKLRWDEWFNLVQTRLMPSFTPVGFKKVGIN